MKRPILYHTIGIGQQWGTVKMHIYPDCFYLTKKRTMGVMDMTGCTETVTHTEIYEDRHICELCLTREKNLSASASQREKTPHGRHH